MYNSRLLTGIQPTGNLHLGNLLGCILPWLRFQSQDFPLSVDPNTKFSSIYSTPPSLQKFLQFPKSPEKLFSLPDHVYSSTAPAPDSLNMLFIADLHSYSTKFDNRNLFQSNNPELMRQAFSELTPSSFESNELLTMLLACGVDPEKTTLFLQSDVPAHSELFYILSCLTPHALLNQMIQYKTKKSSVSSLALYTYPVLMAADILLYNPELLPVGEDQKQHVFLTEQICDRFNKAVSMDVLRMPRLVEWAANKRVMSLVDADNKMSKSDPSEKGVISLKDSPETIYKKIMKARTDSEGVVTADKSRKELRNLIEIYSALEGFTVSQTIK